MYSGFFEGGRVVMVTHNDSSLFFKEDLEFLSLHYTCALEKGGHTGKSVALPSH